jgi:hypothetical protein
MFQTKVVEKITTHFAFSNVSLKNRSEYEIMWKHVVEPGRPQMTLWRMRIACSIPEATNTHSEYVMLTVFPLQQWSGEGATVLHYTYIAFLVTFYILNASSLSE